MSEGERDELGLPNLADEIRRMSDDELGDWLDGLDQDSAHKAIEDLGDVDVYDLFGYGGIYEFVKKCSLKFVENYANSEMSKFNSFGYTMAKLVCDVRRDDPDLNSAARIGESPIREKLAHVYASVWTAVKSGLEFDEMLNDPENVLTDKARGMVERLRITPDEGRELVDRLSILGRHHFGQWNVPVSRIIWADAGGGHLKTLLARESEEHYTPKAFRSGFSFDELGG